MFFRLKKSGERRYLQIVENRRDSGKVRQHVLATVGRIDELNANGNLDALLASGARFSEQAMMLSQLENGDIGPDVGARRIGPPLVFGRLWEETGCRQVLEKLLGGRQFEFPVERAVFTAVLHRIMVSGFRSGVREVDAGLRHPGNGRSGAAPLLSPSGVAARGTARGATGRSDVCAPHREGRGRRGAVRAPP